MTRTDTWQTHRHADAYSSDQSRVPLLAAAALSAQTSLGCLLVWRHSGERITWAQAIAWQISKADRCGGAPRGSSRAAHDGCGMVQAAELQWAAVDTGAISGAATASSDGLKIALAVCAAVLGIVLLGVLGVLISRMLRRRRQAPQEDKAHQANGANVRLPPPHCSRRLFGHTLCTGVRYWWLCSGHCALFLHCYLPSCFRPCHTPRSAWTLDTCMRRHAPHLMPDTAMRFAGACMASRVMRGSRGRGR